ncbi:MAG: hypothetical protein KGL02_07160 [Acidobacteriota bacterium]|nr:hypothetical protein [Acidobacteriota bacterium]
METTLAEFVNRLKDAAGDNLQSVVLFGSAVAGEFSAEHSNLNVLCLIERTGSAELAQLRPAIAWWTEEEDYPAPLVFTFDELRRSAHVFAIELFDIKRHHRILFGADWLENFQPPLALHRLQVERELHRERLKFRRALLAAPEKPKARLDLMLSFVSRFCALFRHAIAAAGEPEPRTRREAVAVIAAWTGADPSGFDAILEFREGKRKRRKIDLEAALHAYVEFVGLAADEATRRFAQFR